ncbi:GTP-binding protein [Ectothiorhodospiraceae bacterium WFHF3C12]|nr:GTP-binding protein [Ectothiorhodospiraceae bacterium WFHF3C12]
MAEPIPGIRATLLCGFLGSGKTTRINRLIRGGKLEDALFLVNDFGSINIDAELIESRDEDVLRLSNGCACCGISGNLSAQLREIKDWPRRPGHLVFEASGIARPRPLMELFDAARGYALEAAESLVDASAFRRHRRDTAIEDIFTAQIREVSRLRVNRAGWLEPDERDAVLREIAAVNPDAEMIVESDEGAPPPAARATTPAPAGPLVSETVNLPHPVDVAALETLLTQSAPALVRAKGTVRADDEARTRYLVQFAGGRVSRTATRYGHTQALVVIGHRGGMLDSLLEALRAL